VLDNGAHHRVLDFAVIQIDADFVPGPEVPVWLFLARHGGRFYRKAHKSSGAVGVTLASGRGTLSTQLIY